MHPLITAAPAPAGSRGPRRRLHHRPGRGRSRRSPSTAPTSSSSPRRTTPPAPRCRWTVIEAVLRGRAGHGRGRRGVRRVPARGHAVAAAAAATATRGCRHPHDVQGVRAGRRPRSATWPPTPPWSTRCSWSGCRTTCRRSPRRWPARRSPTPRSCWATSTRCTRERDDLVGVAARRGLPGGRLRRQLRAVRPVRRPPQRSGRACSTAACWSGRSARRSGCGSPPAPRTRWPRSSPRSDGERDDAPIRRRESSEHVSRRTGRARDQGDRRSSSRSTSTAPGRSTSPPASASSTTCWPSSASTGRST